MSESRYIKAVAQIDAAHKSDPNVESWKEQDYPKEYLYASRMSEVQAALFPEAAEALKIACRSHHIYRWKIPRSDYPMDKAGYHQWRNTLKKFHADQTALILTEVGYSEDFIKEVKSTISKFQLKKKASSQALEDVICIVFLTYYLEPFARRHDEVKVLDILKKTWGKMSKYAQQEALKLEFSSYSKDLIDRALIS